MGDFLDWSELADHIGIDLPKECAERFNLYLAELLKWNRKFNLTGIKNSCDIQIKNFQDSMAISRLICCEKFPLVDIGSGAGFPGLVIKIVRPSLFVELVEPNSHRYNFLCHIKRLLDLGQLEIYKSSIDSWFDKSADTQSKVSALFVSRAWKKPAEVISELAERLFPGKSGLILMLGSKGLKELEKLIPLIKSHGLKVTGSQRVKLTREAGVRLNLLLERF